MPVFKKLVPVFALAALAPLLPGCALSQATPQTTPTPACRIEPVKPEAYFSLTNQGHVLTTARPIRELYNETIDNATLQKLLTDETIPVLESFNMTVGSDSCAKTNFTFSVQDETLARVEKLGDDENHEFGVAWIFDFNGKADNRNLPLLDMGFASDGEEKAAVAGQGQKTFTLEHPLDQKTIDQIRKAQGFALVWD